MQLGMIGLGRMGANMVRRLMRAGHECVVYDVNPRLGRRRSSAEGATGADDRSRTSSAKLDRPADRLDHGAGRASPARPSTSSPRCWAPATSSSTAATATTATTSTPRPAARRARASTTSTCGTSGGVFGLERGYCLMIGGDDEAVDHLDPIFETLAPGVDAAPRTPGRAGDTDAPPSTATCTAARPAPATSSRWSTTASSTG